MHVKQLTEHDWKEITGRIDIAAFQLSVDHLKEKFQLESIRYYEDGLGSCTAFIFGIEDSVYWSRTFGEDEGNQEMIFAVRSYEKDTLLALERLLAAFQINRADLSWIQENLGQAKWKLTRLDDNNNQIEMFRFHDMTTAQQVQKIFEDRGHKQDYYISQI